MKYIFITKTSLFKRSHNKVNKQCLTLKSNNPEHKDQIFRLSIQKTSLFVANTSDDNIVFVIPGNKSVSLKLLKIKILKKEKTADLCINYQILSLKSRNQYQNSTKIKT